MRIPVLVTALFVLGLVLYWPVLDTRPFAEDNLYALAWADAASAQDLITVDPHYYPEWRPLAYATLWIERRAVGSGPIAIHFAVNLALWAACAGLVWLITERLVHSRLAATLSAALVLTDPRATSALVWIIDRQNSLACAFGLAALIVVLRAGESTINWRQAVTLTGLLLGSALSKEHGLAFAAAIGAFAVARKRVDLGGPAVAACAIYAIMRLSIAGGASAPYCEQQYFFAVARDICIEPLQPASWPQMAYNVAIAFINLPLLGFFSGEGRPMVAESRLITGLTLLVLAVVAVRKGPPLIRLIAIVPMTNALLSFMIYRERNQLAGACAMAILAGAGLVPALEMLKTPILRRAAAVTIASLLGAQAVFAHALVVEQQQTAWAIEPCQSEMWDRSFVRPFVAEMKTRYGPV